LIWPEFRRFSIIAKKVPKKMKKGVDKGRRRWYLIEAVAIAAASEP